MIAKITQGSNFTAIMKYTTKERKNHEIVASHKVYSDDVKTIVQTLNRTTANGKKLGKNVKEPCWQCSLSLHPDESLTNEQWDSIASSFVKKMGIGENHQYIAIKHNDTKHQHIHIVVHRIGLDGRLFLAKNDFKMANQACAELEHEFNLKVTNHSKVNAPILATAKKKVTRNEDRKAERVSERPPRTVLAELIEQATEGRPTTRQFVERLQMCGVSVTANISNSGKMSGFGFGFENLVFKGSDVGAGWKKLLEKIDYEQTRDSAFLTTFRPGQSVFTGHADGQELGEHRAGTGRSFDGEVEGIDGHNRIIEQQSDTATGKGSIVTDQSDVQHNRQSRGNSGRDSEIGEGSQQSSGNVSGNDGRNDKDSEKYTNSIVTISSTTERQYQGNGEVSRAGKGSQSVEGQEQGNRFKSNAGRDFDRIDKSVGATLGNAIDDAITRSGCIADGVKAKSDNYAVKRANYYIQDAEKTKTIIKAQLQHTGITNYQLFTLDKEGKGDRKPFKGDILNDSKSLSALRFQNKDGRNVYIKPDYTVHPDVVVFDDINSENLGHMQADGLRYTAIMTSPNNYQVWMTFDRGLSPDERLAVGDYFVQRYGADDGAKGAERLARLAGFANKKDKYVMDGKSPVVAVTEIVPGKVTLTPAMLPLRTQTVAPVQTPKFVDISNNNKELSINQFESFRNISMSKNESGMDWVACKMALSNGYALDSVFYALVESSQYRKVGHEHDYATRTISKAYESVTGQKMNIEQPQKERPKGEPDPWNDPYSSGPSW